MTGVFVAGGSDEFQRRRLVSKIVSTRRGEGWNIVPIDGKEKGALDPIFSMSSMFSANTLAVVENPEKLNPESILEQLRDPDPKVTLLLVTESDKPSGPIFDAIPKTSVKVFSLPASYKLEEYATSFVVGEAKERGYVVDPQLAAALVRRVGTDLGVLAFEVQKVSMLLPKGETVRPEHLRDSLAPLAESDGTAIIEALGSRDASRLSVELVRYKSSRGGDPTIELCGRILTPSLTRWLQAAHLAESGMTAQAAAGVVGSNPWYWEHKVLPYALRWKVAGCARLIGIVANAQTLVFRGGISPFAYLEASLLGILS